MGLDMSYKDNLIDRSPEYYHDDSNLAEYLEVCGEIFDDLRDSIIAMDYYKDYKNSPEKRLALISRQFSFDIPSMIDENVLRGIVRDLSSIYKSLGARKTIKWAMSILSWDFEIEDLWLIFPERYQQKVEEVYPQFYSREGLVSELSQYSVFLPLIGQTYRIGIQYQSYAKDADRIIDGSLLIGENTLLPKGATSQTDPFSTEAGFAKYFDVDRVNKNNFVIGKEIYRDNGVYFQGRTMFSQVDNLFDLRILGESYPTEHIRREYIVMKTPYMSVSILSDNYDQFIDVGGQTFSVKEKFKTAQYLIDYLLYDLFRPLNVAYMDFVNPLDLSDEIGVGDGDTHVIEFDTDPYTTGNQYYFSDAPSYQHFDSIMAIDPTDSSAKQSTEEYQYTIQNASLVADGSGFVSNDVVQLRTPSNVTITSDSAFDVEYKRWRTSNWTKHASFSAGTTSFMTTDVYEIRVRTVNSSAVVSFDVTWLDQSSVSIDFPLSPSFT